MDDSNQQRMALIIIWIYWKYPKVCEQKKNGVEEGVDKTIRFQRKHKMDQKPKYMARILSMVSFMNRETGSVFLPLEQQQIYMK